MKQALLSLFSQAVEALQQQGQLQLDQAIEPKIERTRERKFGDFSCNLAMLLAKPARTNPRQLAQQIVDVLPIVDWVERYEIAGPGFINVFLQPSAYHQVINQALSEKANFGRSQIGAGKSVLLEYVSANPTGPLHVGHGRGAAYGAALADLLASAGYKVDREYYVNDAGRQMDILATSVWLRYLELCEEKIHFPSNGYKGDYIWDIAAKLHRENGDKFHHASDTVFADIAADEADGGDKEAHIDGLIERAKQLLGDVDYRLLFDVSLKRILLNIETDLAEFGVTYQQWFSERQLHENGLIPKALAALKESGHTYEDNGALWFRSTDFGDEKDRVIQRDNGSMTYFAADIAYHWYKLEQQYDHLINIWGADHHGYVPRVKAALTALGGDESRLTVLLVQFASLYRGKEKLAMSTRSGQFVTLRELRNDVGNDAARFFYVMRKSEQHLDFDLELAKSQSNDNPVYYIQYAHARICSVFRQLAEKELTYDASQADYNRLDTEHEQALLIQLSRYPEVLENAASVYEPHQLAYYLRDLSQAFHTYYNAHTFIVDDVALRQARLSLILAVKQVLQNALAILGVSAPEKM